MQLFATVIIGFFIGLLAHNVKPGEDRTSFLPAVVLGMAGAFAGRFVVQSLGFYSSDRAAAFFGAVLGASLVVALLKSSTNKRIPH